MPPSAQLALFVHPIASASAPASLAPPLLLPLPLPLLLLLLVWSLPPSLGVPLSPELQAAAVAIPHDVAKKIIPFFIEYRATSSS
jgi:hypothetical protein